MALSEYEVRKAKAATLKKNGITPYAPRFKKLQNIAELLENHDAREEMKLLRPIEDILQ